MTTQPVSSVSGASVVTPKPAPKTNDTDQLASKDTFLQLLVAQIKNQDPLSPTDGVQFLSQLAQFTQVEQSTQMRDELTAIHDLLAKQVQATDSTNSKKTDGISGNK